MEGEKRKSVEKEETEAEKKNLYRIMNYYDIFEIDSFK